MSTQSLSHLTEPSAAAHASDDMRTFRPYGTGCHTGLTLPSTRWGRVERLLRIETTLALCVPVVCGAAMAWWEQGELNVTILLLLLLAMLCGVMGINVLGEANDYRYTLRPESKYLSHAAIAGSNLIAAKAISLRSAIALGAALLVGAILTTLGLMYMVGWPVLFFALLTFVLYSAYVVPPPYHGYLSWGVGEIGIFVSFGLLNLLNGYYAQAHTLTSLPLWTSVPLGLFCVFVLHTQNFIYQRRDWMLRKRTFAVVLRDRRALNFGVLLALAAYTALLVLVVFLMLPPWVLIGLLALPPTLEALTSARDENLSINSRLILHRTVTRSVLWVCATVALVLYLR